MGYLTDGLTFNNLRGANLARLPLFKNAKGERSHPEMAKRTYEVRVLYSDERVYSVKAATPEAAVAEATRRAERAGRTVNRVSNPETMSPARP